MENKAMKFKVKWGDGFSQEVKSKTEALKIASQLLSDYKNVSIENTTKTN